MTAEQFLSLADALRSYAQHSGRDLNAANLFVHSMLMRAVRGEDIARHLDQDAPGALERRAS